MSTTNDTSVLRRSKRKRNIKSLFGNTAFLIPFLVLFLVFFIIPFIYSLYISFYDWNLFRPERTEFVGLENFKRILFDNDSIYFDYFWSGLKNTLIFVLISVPLLIIVPLFFSILVDLEPVGYKVFRVILFMPTVFSISAVILIWRWQFFTGGGFINSILLKLGLSEIPFLVSQPWAWISILVVTIWWTMGINMVILGAGLKNIDKSLYEAASIDGASYMKTLMHITIPSLAPQMFVVAITTTLASFNVYGQPDLLTNGGPEFSTTVLMMRIRALAIGARANPGIATTMALMLGVLMITVSIFQAKVLKRMGE